jgi:hypothetical protein
LLRIGIVRSVSTIRITIVNMKMIGSHVRIQSCTPSHESAMTYVTRRLSARGAGRL